MESIRSAEREDRRTHEVQYLCRNHAAWTSYWRRLIQLQSNSLLQVNWSSSSDESCLTLTEDTVWDVMLSCELCLSMRIACYITSPTIESPRLKSGQGSDLSYCFCSITICGFDQGVQRHSHNCQSCLAMWTAEPFSVQNERYSYNTSSDFWWFNTSWQHTILWTEA